jgi:hypothetical protein
MYKQKKRISARTLISLKFAYLFKIQIKRMESHAVGIESSILFCFLIPRVTKLGFVSFFFFTNRTLETAEIHSKTNLFK